MRHEYRVTKYDPRFRDARGAYTRHEWTSISDVGRRFGRRVLTMPEYLDVEAKYLDVLKAMLSEAEVSFLELRALEVKRPHRRWRDGQVLSVREAIDFSRLALREELWGRLVAPRRAFVHFGYDYYVFVGVSRRVPAALAFASKLGIFVEEFPSPCHEEYVLQRRLRPKRRGRRSRRHSARS